jgi:hypothetical protein
VQIRHAAGRCAVAVMSGNDDVIMEKRLYRPPPREVPWTMRQLGNNSDG